MKKILFISNWAQGKALSGGDRIWIELAKRWNRQCNLEIFCSDEARQMCTKLEAANLKFVSVSRQLKTSNLILAVLQRSIQSIRRLPEKNHYDIIYSASDFWPDSIPAFIMKLRDPKAKWIAGFYMFAPKPWQKTSPYRGKRWFIGLFYWLTQLPIYWIVKKYADMVFVTSEPDTEKFVTKKRGRDKILVIRGGVDIKPSVEYLKSGNVIPIEKRKYDACFVGRFHPQKGVLELIDIWELVCKEKPDAKLAMIGIGPLEKEIKDKIEGIGLQNNIKLLGFKDGEDKYEVFKQNKIVVHPAIYDSGGMAACEAMACGLPGVSFDLEALRTYYPKGMLKTPCYNLKIFAKNIIKLLEDKELYERTKKDAIAWAKEWDWDKRADHIFQKVMMNL